MRTRAMFATLLLPLAMHGQSTVPPVSDTGITNIGKLLDSCPTDDPAYSAIRSDFQIRRNDIPVGDIACTDPISTLARPQFSQEIVLLQALRVIYYMDRGRSNYLPWTNLRMYDWLKTKVAGMNIKNTGAASAYCCDVLDGKRFIVLQDYNNIPNLAWDAYRTWRGISGQIGLFGHEARHVDGFPHVTCCPTVSNCDQTYDEKNLSAVGIQNWFWRAFLNGTINVCANCLPGNQVVDIGDSFLQAANQANGPGAFCDAKPPLAVLPDNPGGACKYRTLSSALTAAGVTNAASYRSTSIAPGELITIFGTGIDVPALSTFQLDSSLNLPTTLANTRVYVNGVPSPIIYATQNQVSAIVPYGTTAPSAYLEIENNGLLTNFVKVPVTATQPEFFTLDGSGKGQIAALNEDGTLNSVSSPARRGSIMVAYATGGGITNPPSNDGQINAVPLPGLRAGTRVLAQGRDAEIRYAGPAPGLVSGVLQVNFMVPLDAPIGPTATVQLVIGGSGSIQNTSAAIR